VAWQPIALKDLQELIKRELAECDPAQRTFFLQVQMPPSKWSQAPWGSEGGGFWVIATHQERALWYNDIEDGFNVSRFTSAGVIPADEYWCNQDSLGQALRNLSGEPMVRRGAPSRP